MILSRDRILTTHVGSLPRPQPVVDILLRKERGEAVDPGDFDRIVAAGVAGIVARQTAVGLDLVSDGEMSKIGYSTYIKDRLSGFGDEEYRPKPHLDLRDHPEYRKKLALMTGPATIRRMCCTGPIALVDRQAALRDVAHMAAAVEAAKPTGAFLNAASPGVVASFQPNRFYPTHEAYIEAVAEAMRYEYETIAGSGMALQIDCPDLAMSRHTGFQELSDAEFLVRAEHNIEALNHALRNIPAESVRMHVCWGNYEGPHDFDIALEKIMPIVLKARARTILFEAANPRHEHEWTVWRQAKLPDDRVLVPGVISSSSNYVEHPELVAQRICRFADIVGRERVIAGTDCGFGTFAGYGKIDPDIAFKKLAALVRGAEIASAALWK